MLDNGACCTKLVLHGTNVVITSGHRSVPDYASDFGAADNLGCTDLIYLMVTLDFATNSIDSSRHFQALLV